MLISFRMSANMVFGFLLMILTVAFLYIIAGQKPVPEWLLQFTFYAFMTALFGFIFLGILAPLVRDRLKEAKMKKIDRKMDLETLKAEYGRCAWSIENNLDKHVRKNKITDFVARLEARNERGMELETSEELENQIQKYNEKCKDYSLFRKISERLIVEEINKKAKRMFPKSLKKSDELSRMLCADFLMERYFNGEQVTANWLRDTYPKELKNIYKEIDETERHELDILFNEINTDFEESDELQRFIKEKKELLAHGQETIKALRKEAQSLDEQLEQYKNLRVPPSHENNDIPQW